MLVQYDIWNILKSQPHRLWKLAKFLFHCRITCLCSLNIKVLVLLLTDEYFSLVDPVKYFIPSLIHLNRWFPWIVLFFTLPKSILAQFLVCILPSSYKTVRVRNYRVHIAQDCREFPSKCMYKYKKHFFRKLAEGI